MNAIHATLRYHGYASDDRTYWYSVTGRTVTLTGNGTNGQGWYTSTKAQGTGLPALCQYLTSSNVAS